jgi:hypothetical protein
VSELGAPQRLSDAIEQIAAARAEPTDAARMADVDAANERWNAARNAALRDSEPPAAATDSLTLTGPELAAYRQLQAAAAAAHADQQRMAVSGASLREAIHGLCAVIAPGQKP